MLYLFFFFCLYYLIVNNVDHLGMTQVAVRDQAEKLISVLDMYCSHHSSEMNFELITKD